METRFGISNWRQSSNQNLEVILLKECFDKSKTMNEYYLVTAMTGTSTPRFPALLDDLCAFGALSEARLPSSPN